MNHSPTAPWTSRSGIGPDRSTYALTLQLVQRPLGPDGELPAKLVHLVGVTQVDRLDPASPVRVDLRRHVVEAAADRFGALVLREPADPGHQRVVHEIDHPVVMGPASSSHTRDRSGPLDVGRAGGSHPGQRRRVETIDLGDADEVDELRRQLTVGAERALDELERQRDTLRSGPIPDREVQGAVGEWFNSVEKVMSVSEPEIFRFKQQGLRRAFLDEPACRHVIQQFVDE